MLNQLPAHTKLAKQMAESEIESSIPLTAIISVRYLTSLNLLLREMIINNVGSNRRLRMNS